MTVILDKQTIPEKGQMEVKVDVSFEIRVAAREARRRVDRWLFEEVSYMIGANEPDLVIGERVVWRVPAWIGFASAGPFTIGAVDVDVETGEMIDLPGCKERILEYLEREVKPRLPKYRQRTETPVEYLATNVPPARKLNVAEEKPAQSADGD
ncbi:MAG: hypothetical protein AAB382_08875 [Chloroflexota bacterium]